jgi:hypothetical protein
MDTVREIVVPEWVDYDDKVLHKKGFYSAAVGMRYRCSMLLRLMYQGLIDFFIETGVRTEEIYAEFEKAKVPEDLWGKYLHMMIKKEKRGGTQNSDEEDTKNNGEKEED